MQRVCVCARVYTKNREDTDKRPIFSSLKNNPLPATSAVHRLAKSASLSSSNHDEDFDCFKISFVRLTEG